jgi:hypothetical protein
MPIRPIKITDYEQQANADFITQYKESDVKDLIQGAMIEIQKIEEATQDFYLLLPLQNATGQTLDRWGFNFDVERGGLGDTTFRDKILAQILSYTSSGKPDQILQIISLLTQAISIRLIEQPPRAIGVDIQTDFTTISGTELRNAIVRALESTIKLSDLLIISPVEYFGFANDPDAEGFATLTDSSGGFYSILI